MRRKKRIVIWTAVIVLLMVGLLAIYLYDVIWLQTPFTRNLFRIIAVQFLLLGTLAKIRYGAMRNGLEAYEKLYADELGYAFKNKPFQRKKLLCACRLCSEGNSGKALKYLMQLLKEAEFDRDKVPVLLFMAVSYTDIGCIEYAIEVYLDLLDIAPNHGRAHSNLGNLYINAGKLESALEHINKAIKINPKNYYAYANRANYYFQMKEYDNAIADAKQALEIKNNGIEAADLLTIVYALQGDKENQEKYYHIAIASGKDPQELI